MSSSTTNAKKRKYLTLKEKVQVIKNHGEDSWHEDTQLSQIFDCGKTQIGKIIKNKDSILSMYEANESQTAKHDRKMSGATEYIEINKASGILLPVPRRLLLHNYLVAQPSTHERF